MRVIADVSPLLADAFRMPDGPDRDACLEIAIGHAIDAGREAGDAMRAERDRLRGELADAQQAKNLLVERNRRLQAALDAANARIRVLANADRGGPSE
jgi:ABC-type transporter Mla subunit MlaD